MATGGFFKRIFGSQDSGRANFDTAQAKRVIDAAQKIISDYGEALSKSGGMVRDIEELPYSKENIKIAAKVLLKVMTDPTMREHLKVAYLSLSTFQPLTQSQKRSLHEWNAALGGVSAESATDMDKTIELLGKAGGEAISIQNATVSEMAVLRQELETEGYW